MQTNGNVSLAARTLNLTRNALYARIRKSRKLQEVLEDARESLVDIAETSLRSAVLAGQPWAVTLALKTLGRPRGYTENPMPASGDLGSINAGVVIQQNFLSADERDAMVRRFLELGNTLTPLKYQVAAPAELDDELFQVTAPTIKNGN